MYGCKKQQIFGNPESTHTTFLPEKNEGHKKIKWLGSMKAVGATRWGSESSGVTIVPQLSGSYPYSK